MIRRSLLLLALVATVPMQAVASTCEWSTEPALSEIGAAIRSARRSADGRWYENERLPYRGEWLDTVEVLGGLTQQDRLRATRHDEEKCGAMVGLAAALVGGPDAFEKLLDRLEPGARGRDRVALANARAHFEAKALTAADLHLVSEVLYRELVGGRDGSSDGDISRMVRASGWKRTKVDGAKTPAELLRHLAPGEAFPMCIYDEYPDFTGWHVVLVWKDAAGVARVYDSDIESGSQVTREGTARFREGYLEYVAKKSGIPAEWAPRTKFSR